MATMSSMCGGSGRTFLRLAERWRPHYLLVEDAASGQSLVQTLRAGTRLPVKAIKVDRDKESRAAAILPLIESGKVFLPQGAEWVAQFVDECASFPAGAHDDCVDALTQVLNYAAPMGTTGMYAVMKLNIAAARVERGESVEAVAKDVSLTVGRLDGWVARRAERAQAQPPEPPPRHFIQPPTPPFDPAKPRWNPWMGTPGPK
jgi:hypothetical protein